MERTGGFRNIGTTAVGVVVGALLIFALLPARDSTRATPTTGPGDAAPRTISVSGEGRMSAAPDRARVELGVVVQRPTVAEAQAAGADAMRRVLDGVRANGIPDERIQTAAFSLQPQYEYPQNAAPRLVGYTLTNIVAVTIDRLDKVGPVIDDAMKAGATTVGSIAFTVADPEKVTQEARAKAVANAQRHADALATAAGLRVGAVLSITEGGPTPPPIVYRDGKEVQGGTPIQPGSTEVSVTVSVIFEIAS